MKLIKHFLAILILSSSLGAFAQVKNKDYNQAEESFNLGMFAEAIEAYKKAYIGIPENHIKAEIVFKLGICYKNINEPKSAELWFKKAIAVKYPDPLTLLYYADMLKMNEKYEEAIKSYKDYMKVKPEDPRGEQGVESCKLVSQWRAKPTRYRVENMAFLNSKENDFCPTYAKKDYSSIYFSSTRESTSGAEKSKVTGAFFSDIFETSRNRQGKWTEPVPLNAEVNSPNDEGASTTNMPKANELFFTRCRVEKNVMLGCQICSASKKGLTWGDVNVIPIAADSIGVGHPSITFDELTLYFAADMPGGQGGSDIWMIKRPAKNKPWVTEAINLGTDINTRGNEMFPYIHKDGTLYFSSDYHLGMGGLDIFKATPTKSDKWTVENLKYPLNSPADDFAITFHQEEERGFLTSSRPGGKGGDDIYSFELPPIEYFLEGVVINNRTNEIIPGAKIEITVQPGDKLPERLSEADGSFKQQLGPNLAYAILASKEGFLKGEAKVSTKLIETDTTFKVEIRLDPIDKVIKLENIYYDVGTWTLRPESYPELDKLVDVLNKNSDIVIELMAHTDFRPIPITNDTLSQKRAESVVSYLVEKGIDMERLIAKGYGDKVPHVITKEDAEKYSFLKEGNILDKKFILALPIQEQQETAHQLNRRTEFKVLRQDYKGDLEESTPQ
ncbi:MAG: OmpA family protein [Bacteroidales bacterium]|nr:OmpA family protein [Bacteroidales bacterium]